MAETKVNIAQLKDEGSDLIKELADFLKEQTKAEVDILTDDIVVKSEEKPISRTYLRVLLRKFLHKQELKEYYRIIGGKENTLVIKKKPVKEEE
jgi:hypothetical protein